MLEKSIAIISKVQNLIKPIAHRLALPFICILCTKPSDREQDLCQACLNDLPTITQKCPRCAQKIESSQSYLCGYCLNNLPPFTHTYTLFAYQPPITSFILHLKFHHQFIYARIMGELMSEKIRQEWYLKKPLPDLIMPVPLHPLRLKERGFNQALEIARPIKQQFNLSIDVKSAKRIQYTPTQMNLSAENRRINIKNAFVVAAPFILGKKIAIIDDVMTTGATVTELSRVLIQQGAAQVDIWCCARA